MKYSLFNSSTPEYERDEQGNIIYTEVNGQQVPVETGEEIPAYATPVDFKASISSELNEMHVKSYGVDQSSIYSELVTEKNLVPITVGTLIWVKSPVEWEDVNHTIPKAESADYTVVGLMDENMYCDMYLLQRKSNEK
jgi:hypothetical protein